VLATGHYRSGILLAPVTADAVAAILAGEEHAIAEAFAPSRFGGAERPATGALTR
jgi:glycine oxidase